MNNLLLKEAVALCATITPLINAAIVAGDDDRYQRLARISTRAHNRVTRRSRVVIDAVVDEWINLKEGVILMSATKSGMSRAQMANRTLRNTKGGCVMARVDSMREAWLNPPDEINYPICQYCGEHHENGDEDYCSFEHWHLDNLGKLKSLVLSWFEKGYNDKKIIDIMTMDCGVSWFEEMTGSTVRRWKNAISARYQQDQTIIAQAKEIENYNNGY